MRYLRITVVALALGAWTAGPLVGSAAARLLAPTYVSSSPEKNAMMDEPPSEVTVTFSEPLDPSSVLNVLDECGNEVDDGPATITVNEMEVGIAKTPSGTYTVVYRAVGVAGATGTSASTFEFMVHDGKPCKGAHGGHGGHDKDEKDGKHDDHGRRDDHGEHDEMTDHGEHSTGGPDHAGMDHGSMDHGSMPMDHGGDGKGGHGKHRPSRPPAGAGDANPPLAGGEGAPPLRADGRAMLIGLAVALAVGVFGGWLLRLAESPPGGKAA